MVRIHVNPFLELPPVRELGVLFPGESGHPIWSTRHARDAGNLVVAIGHSGRDGIDEEHGAQKKTNNNI